MPTNRIQCQDVLTDGELAGIDALAAANRGDRALPVMAEFLRDKFNADFVLDKDIIAGFAHDSSNLPGRADALCRPQSERELAAVFRLCFSGGIPFTISGGRSSLTGSATPESGVVISTVKMLAPPVKADLAQKTVSAPAGIILEDMRRAALEQSNGKLYFPVDPTSRADAFVGGALACNASGFTPGADGAIRSWVNAVDFMLPNGMKITARRGEYVSENGLFLLAGRGNAREIPVPRYPRLKIKNAGGPYSAPEGALDFVDLVVGSEGIFGAVTACEMRLAPVPDGYLDLFFSLPAEENAVSLLEYLRNKLPGGPGRLTALEYFGVHCRKYMAHENRLFRGTNQVGVYIQEPLRGVNPEDAALAWLERLAAAGCGVDENAVMMLDNDRDRKIFMEARHSMPANALEMVQRRGTYTIMTDTVVPPENFREFLKFTHSAIRAENLDYLSFGHLGDCHLHFTILPEKDRLARATAVYDLIIAESARLGGVYSGEHGTGKRKRRDFLRCYGLDAVAQVRKCKAAVDPQFLLNRGNVIEIGIQQSAVSSQHA
ncbi:MAG: FAD-binding oxidoreductase [Kiritimatiellae bacterium]|nr:FAD-binding oxidoreductase [Kiritimatiellia bacterium]